MRPEWIKRAIECNDGFTMSLQASATHYCSPRIDNLPIYMSYEICCEIQEILKPYFQHEITDTDCVYGYVPTSVVIKLIEHHEGIKGFVEAVE